MVILRWLIHLTTFSWTSLTMQLAYLAVYPVPLLRLLCMRVMTTPYMFLF